MKQKAVIGVDLGGTNVRAGNVVENKITAHQTRAISAHGTQDLVLQEIRETISAVFDDEVSAIGIGVPSLVDVDRGVVFTVPNIPAWKKVALKDYLQQAFQVPVHVNNDANCFALGEFYFGTGRGFKNLVGMIVGTGLGAGIIINGKLYCGRNCGAGEIGKIAFKEQTVEYYCSGQFFQRQYGMDGETLFAQAQTGQQKALEIFAAFGTNFGHALMTALYAYDPEIIILGGSVSNSWTYFEATARRVLHTSVFPHALEHLIIGASQTPKIAVLGAAALCYNE